MIAFYMRLSVAQPGADGEQSCSIATQDMILTRWLESHPELSGMEVRRFVDDGFSGCSLNRPAMQEMLDLCRRKEVSLVAVKDMSRLSRDYLDAGDLVERVLPLLGIRFVSVSEGYDSIHVQNSVEDAFLLGFRNIVNSSYVRELSVKKRAGNRSAWRRGRRVNAVCPFGFVWDPSVPGRMAPDPVASGYVKRIFQVCAESKSTGEAARSLEAEGIPTPAVYAHQSEGIKSGFVIRPKRAAWNGSKVRRIINTEEYLGTLLGGKTQQLGVGRDAPSRNTKREEQIVYENAHEPLVTREEWNAAQRCIQKGHENSASPRGKGKPGLFTGLVFCPECGWECKTLRHGRYGGDPYGYAADCDCGNWAEISEEDLERAVHASIDSLMAVAGVEARRAQRLTDERVERKAICDSRIRSLMAKRDKVKAQRVALYERFGTCEVDERYYARMSARLRKEADAIGSDLDAAYGELRQMAEQEASCESVMAAEECLRSASRGRMPRDAVQLLVKRIELDSDGNVAIFLNFADVFEEALDECS